MFKVISLFIVFLSTVSFYCTSTVTTSVLMPCWSQSSIECSRRWSCAFLWQMNKWITVSWFSSIFACKFFIAFSLSVQFLVNEESKWLCCGARSWLATTATAGTGVASSSQSSSFCSSSVSSSSPSSLSLQVSVFKIVVLLFLSLQSTVSSVVKDYTPLTFVCQFNTTFTLMRFKPRFSSGQCDTYNLK